MNSFTSVGRSSGRPPVGRGEPGDALPSGRTLEVRADTSIPDNFIRERTGVPTANLGGGA